MVMFCHQLAGFEVPQDPPHTSPAAQPFAVGFSEWLLKPL
jgi:hypothetical protein